MKLSALALLLLGVLATAAPADPGDKKDAPPKKRSFTVGKDTTYVTGPLDKDGRIDYPAALNARLAKGVTPDTNAVVLLMKALGPKPEGGEMDPDFFRMLGIPVPPEQGDYLVRMGPFARDRLKIKPDDGERLAELYDEQLRAARWPWTAEQFPRVAEWLSLNEKPLALIAEATKRPQYFHPLTPFPIHKGKKDSPGLVNSNLAAVQVCREAAVALTARAMLRVGRGDVGGAWQDLLTCHRLGRQVGRGATMIESLVGFAIEGVARQADLAFLDRGKLDTKQLDVCLRDLRELPPMAGIAEKVALAERFVVLENISRLDPDDVKFKEVFSSNLYWLNFEAAKAQLNWDQTLANANRWYDRLADVLRETDRATRKRKLGEFNKDIAEYGGRLRKDVSLAQALRESKEPGKVLGDAVGSQFTVGLSLTASSMIPDAADRARQEQDNLLVAFVLARYRLDHGRYPKELAALAPKYVKEVPADLFSGKPLVYRPTEAGYRLSSVGVNGKDEEGRGRDDDPPADDLTVRMPVPEPNKKQP